MERSEQFRGHRKRVKHVDVEGHWRYLTFSCFQRRPFLSGERSREWLREAVERAREVWGFKLAAYVFMPEHVHLLVLPTRAPWAVSGILGGIKLPVSREARRFVEAHAPGFLERMVDVRPNGERVIRFWQRGPGYDRNIYTREELVEKVNYIHLNPVRRGLVKEMVEWEWSSAREYAGGVGRIRVDRVG